MSCTGLRIGFHKARKPHRCDSCGASIQAGERYHQRVYTFDGVFIDEKLHTWCWGELKWFFDETMPDEFDWDEVSDFVTAELHGYGRLDRDEMAEEGLL